MNIDGASFGNPGPGGLGCVLRNYLAGFHLAITLPILHCSSLFAELSALRFELQVLNMLRISNVIIETDSQVLVTLMAYNEQSSLKILK
ncbi:hypothetical protein FRX31_029648 [Thalictrum thalictroides]|uniref:RNase H type-1 domain-containing protein n=1 Tax=Thalictrum thalictroides TaxID=46969 RepID=A0A7J6V6L7_THATH|nr:hypothetical protein FRX31_029648 [Thalictrum thalictroides]